MKKMIPLLMVVALFNSCGEDDGERNPDEPGELNFLFGADLSYVNQVVDYGGVYKENNVAKEPFEILRDRGANLVRIRIWHNPVWTKEVYGENGVRMYSDLPDVEKSIQSAKDLGMKVLLDFHYSDTWADPGNQYIPEAWRDIEDITALEDSIYNYTRKTLEYLESKTLMPEYIQVGNETNCGFLFSEAPDGFPPCNVCNDHWVNFGKAVNSAIKAIGDAAESSAIKPEIILHVADPKNVTWWFDNVTAANKGNVSAFDIIGFSYYPLWHRTIPIAQLSNTISSFKSKYSKDVMILETAYPWTTEAKDSYNNHFGNETALGGFPYSPEGQRKIMIELVSEVIQGGGIGVIYWEPAWISSQMKDLWGTGSAWENSTFFDFDGNVHVGIDYMDHDYKK